MNGEKSKRQHVAREVTEGAINILYYYNIQLKVPSPAEAGQAEMPFIQP